MNEHCDWCLLEPSTFCFLLGQAGFYYFVSDRVINRVGQKWKCPGSSVSDSVMLMTPLVTLIFDFHSVISAQMTLPMTLTQTLSLVKTSFKCPNVTLPLSPLTLLWVCHGFVSLLDTQYFFVILATCPIYIFLKQRLLFFLSNYNTILSWLPHSNPRSSSDFLNLNSPSFPRTWCLLY